MNIVKRLSEMIFRLVGGADPARQTKKKENLPLGMKKCPQCGNLVMKTAFRCVHCNYVFGPRVQG